jgi:hypothetical protein
MEQPSRAYEEFHFTLNDLKLFLVGGLRAWEQYAEQLWQEIGNRPSDGEGPEQADLYEREIGLYPHEYEFMHHAAVLKDAVSAFEIYLEAAREEVVSRSIGMTTRHKTDYRTPRFEDLREFFKKVFGLTLAPSVDEVRTLRHILTHRRGELRRREERERFAQTSDSPFMQGVASLTTEVVMDYLDSLSAAASLLDQAVWASAYGSESRERLQLYILERNDFIPFDDYERNY